MLSEFKTTLKHTSIYGMGNILKKGAAFFMIPVYTRFLTPSEYGTLELLELVLDVVTLMVGLRLGEAVIRYYHHYETREDKMAVVSTGFFFCVGITVLAVLICQGLASTVSGVVFGDTAHTAYLRWIFICLGCQLLYLVPEVFLIIEKRSVTYSGLSFATFILALCLNILFLVVLKMGIWGMIYSMVITKLTYMALVFGFVLPRLPLAFSFSKLRQMVRFGLPLLPGVLSLFVINFSDRFFIQQFSDSHDLGIYSLGYKFGILLVVLITDPFFRIWNTQRYEIAGRPDGSIVIGRYFTYYLAALTTLALGLCLFSGSIIYFMADASFHASSAIIPLIAVSYIFQGIAGFATVGIMVTYKTRYILFANLVTAAVNIGLNAFLIRYWGIYGAAVSTIVSYAFLFALVATLSQRLYRIRFEFLRLAKLVGFAGLVAILGANIHGPGLWDIGVKGVMFLLFPLGLWLGCFFTKEEVDRIRTVFS